MNPYHQDVLSLIKEKSGKGTQHTSLDNYLGNSHPRYPIDSSTLRSISKEWMKDHRDMTAKQFAAMLTSMVRGESGTEKVMVGILLDACTKEQRKFDPKLFDKWLDYVEGWAEVDSICTGRYCDTEIPENIQVWKKILVALVKSKNINKRRASIVFLCSPVSKSDDPRLADIALANIEKLKSEKEIIITRAISWLLRNMIRHHRKAVETYISENENTLPKIALRETRIKLKTGTKNQKKKI